MTLPLQERSKNCWSPPPSIGFPMFYLHMLGGPYPVITEDSSLIVSQCMLTSPDMSLFSVRMLWSVWCRHNNTWLWNAVEDCQWEDKNNTHNVYSITVLYMCAVLLQTEHNISSLYVSKCQLTIRCHLYITL